MLLENARSRTFYAIVIVGVAATLTGAPLSSAAGQDHDRHDHSGHDHGASPGSAQMRQVGPHVLGLLEVWNDGNSEMSYYDATDEIYGKTRSYTRVHLVNRQWMDPEKQVKTDESPSAVPVFKLNISEEIPTENYHYRFLTTVFLRKPTLLPFKMVVSSQEWCGASFKNVRWGNEGLKVYSSGYFPGEGDRHWTTLANPVPYEGLLLVARDVAAVGQPREFFLLRPMRSTKEVEPKVTKVQLVPGEVEELRLPIGTKKARRVDLLWDGAETWFYVDVEPPHLLLKYRLGAQRGELKAVERRPYWDRSSKSKVYKQGDAP